MSATIHGTYKEADCTFLLRDMNGVVTPISQAVKKEQMSAGKKSYEMIPFEYKVDQLSESIFLRLLSDTSKEVARVIGVLAESIYSAKGNNTVLVSLARGGIPVGVLCKRYLETYYGVSLPHYVISLIRNEGIDDNALNYIVNHHPQANIQFIDGWTGIGYISQQLEKYVMEHNQRYGRNVDPALAVAIDSSKICSYCGTRKDAILPSCCLNATVCGMISSIYYDKGVLDENDFHGALQWDESIGRDYSNFFIEEITKHFSRQKPETNFPEENYAKRCLDCVKQDFPISNNKNIKLGIGESTRAIIRYDLEALLVRDPTNPNLAFLIEIANAKEIPVIIYDKTEYESIALICEKEVF